MKAKISKILEAGGEIPLRSTHQHSGGESVQLDGLPDFLFNKRRLTFHDPFMVLLYL